jgi:2-amino-4-hydroxy-6-hydroxymethyldihydropteridine diphosphokinase
MARSFMDDFHPSGGAYTRSSVRGRTCAMRAAQHFARRTSYLMTHGRLVKQRALPRHRTHAYECSATQAASSAGVGSRRQQRTPARDAAVISGYLGLGSNVGDRLANLREARDRLQATTIRVVRSSSVYESEPQGEVLDQDPFLNAVVAIECEMHPEQLLDVCKRIEQELGRDLHARRHSPRPIDIDLLCFDFGEHRSSRLTIPHSALPERRFVIEPLAELESGLVLPDGRRLADLLATVADQAVDRVGVL